MLRWCAVCVAVTQVTVVTPISEAAFSSLWCAAALASPYAGCLWPSRLPGRAERALRRVGALYSALFARRAAYSSHWTTSNRSGSVTLPLRAQE